MLRICSLALICLSTPSALAQDVTPATADLMKQAEASCQAKHFNESASLYSRALPLVQDNDRAGVEYNQFVKRGELLFEIDDRPYRYALGKALSDQAALEGQIEDEQRKIAALVSGVSISQAKIHSSQAGINRWGQRLSIRPAQTWQTREQGVNLVSSGVRLFWVGACCVSLSSP